MIHVYLSSDGTELGRLDLAPDFAVRSDLRERMYAEINLSGTFGAALSISSSDRLLATANVLEVYHADYPAHDMLNLSAFEDESFDLVVSDQVLEHVKGNPQTAIDQCWRVLRPGGVALHTTCFMLPVHFNGYDFWRFTPAGLQVLHERWANVTADGYPQGDSPEVVWVRAEKWG